MPSYANQLGPNLATENASLAKLPLETALPPRV